MPKISDYMTKFRPGTGMSCHAIRREGAKTTYRARRSVNGFTISLVDWKPNNWVYANPNLAPNAEAEAGAEAKRQRRKERNKAQSFDGLGCRPTQSPPTTGAPSHAP